MQVHVMHETTRVIDNRSGAIEVYSLHVNAGPKGAPQRLGCIARATKGAQKPLAMVNPAYDEARLLKAFTDALDKAGARRTFSFAY